MEPRYLFLLRKVRLSFGRVILGYVLAIFPSLSLILVPLFFNLILYFLNDSPYVLNNSTFHENFSFLSLIHIVSHSKHTYIYFFLSLDRILESPASILKSIILQVKDNYSPNLETEGKKSVVSSHDGVL